MIPSILNKMSGVIAAAEIHYAFLWGLVSLLVRPSLRGLTDATSPTGVSVYFLRSGMCIVIL